MISLPKILLVDDVDENRYLIVKTLFRTMPSATIYECQESAPALIAVQNERITVAIIHRCLDADGVTMIKRIRAKLPLLPIVMVSGRESCPEALEAGATIFLNYESWMQIGTTVQGLLDSAAKSATIG